jgi:hypothetical protein
LLSLNRFQGAGSNERWFAPIVRLRPGVPLVAVQQAIDESVDSARRQLGVEDQRFGAKLFTLRTKSMVR